MDEKSQQAIKLWTLAQPVVSAFVSSVVRDFRDRDDVLQSVAVAVFESIESYDATRPFIGWAMGVAKNQVGTYLREKYRHRMVFDQATIDALSIAFERNSTEGLRSLDFLQDCLQKLEGRARQVCQLRYENDLKPAAIAALVGMTPNNVAKSLQRVREQLRQCIERRAALEGESL